jgi:hypothetical protein
MMSLIASDGAYSPGAFDGFTMTDSGKGNPCDMISEVVFGWYRHATESEDERRYLNLNV